MQLVAYLITMDASWIPTMLWLDKKGLGEIKLPGQRNFLLRKCFCKIVFVQPQRLELLHYNAAHVLEHHPRRHVWKFDVVPVVCTPRRRNFPHV